MGLKSKIEWTEATWNPVRGCSKISPGCANCYAQRFAERFRGTRRHAYEMGFDVRLAPEKLLDPVTWAKPRMIFANSMSDLFHEDVPESYIEDVCQVMLAANWHTYQILTKRAMRMGQLLKTRFREAARAPHIWWGVSVEDKFHGFPRMDWLWYAATQVAFISAEPLLEDLGPLDLSKLDWVIVGGESGPRARPMEADWVRAIRDQCQRAHVPFFFKQWGGVNKVAAGRLLDGQMHEEMPARTMYHPLPALRSALLAKLNTTLYYLNDQDN